MENTTETHLVSCSQVSAPGHVILQRPASDILKTPESGNAQLSFLQKIAPSTRHYCTFCGKKRNRENLNLVFYKLLQKKAWHCKEHASTLTDIVQIETEAKGVFLELFAGSKHISTIAGQLGFETFTVDYEKKFKPDLCSDIRKVKLNQLPGSVAFIWASIPCTVFSVLSIARHWEKITYSWRKYFYIPKTQEAKEALQIVEKTLWLIRKLKPKYFVIENPRGAMRHLPQLRAIPFRHTVSYADYGFDYYKPTDLFTNIPDLKLIPLRRDFDEVHAGSVVGLNSAFERSLVPGQLIEEILQQVKS